MPWERAGRQGDAPGGPGRRPGRHTPRTRPVVTAAVDSLEFLHPVHVGELIVLRSSVNRVFRTSMEVGVTVETENLSDGAESAHLLGLPDVRGAGRKRKGDGRYRP